MTDRPAYFTVALILGREHPAIYWDELPRAPIRNLVYVVRLDALPNGPALARASLAQLFEVYRLLKGRGKLPPGYEPPPRPKPPPTTVQLGEHYHRIDNTRWRDRPLAEPVPGLPRPDAPAYIAAEAEA